MEAETLAPLVEQGLSTRAIGRKLDRSQTTIRYWIGKHGLSPAAKEAKTSSCEGCGVSYEPGRNARGRYCSTVCHGLHRTASRYARWLAGDPDAFTFPPALRRAVEQRDGLSCAICRGTEWCGRPMPLELEHKGGNSENNSPANLCLLCPNCHAQTPTYKARNRGHWRHRRRQRYAAGQSYRRSGPGRARIRLDEPTGRLDLPELGGRLRAGVAGSRVRRGAADRARRSATVLTPPRRPAADQPCPGGRP